MPDPISLELAEREWTLIIELLEREIPGLREEIHHTDDWRYRDALKEKKQASLALLVKLQHLPTLQ
jgi:hypothetical protein